MNKQDLISKIKQLDGISQDERAYLINLVNTKKKYGLVWEDNPEQVEEQLRENLPVLKEVKEKAIVSGNDDSPNHVLIEGDNLHALTALTFTHENKIDVIYIDPPYNTGKENEFRYNDKWILKEDPFKHSTWLNFISKRLKIAKRLLTEEGVFICHIDENEFDALNLLLETEIFSNNDFLGVIIWNKLNPKGEVAGVATMHEYVLIYAKNKENFKNLENILTRSKPNALTILNKAKTLFLKIGKKQIPESIKEVIKPFNYSKEIIKDFEVTYDLELVNTEFQSWISKQDFSGGEKAYQFIDENGNVYQSVSMAAPDKPETRSHRPLIHPVTNKSCPVPAKGWRNPDRTMDKLLKDGLIIFGKDENTQPRKKYLLKENLSEVIPSIYNNGASDEALMKDLNINFPYPKVTSASQYLLKNIHPNPKIILDFFAGSGTTLHATMALNFEDGGNRQCILVTNNENNICEEVTYERNKRVIQGYTNAKGVAVEGLKNNNLRYYKSEFVSRDTSLKNKRELTYLATELLCIKEDCYTAFPSKEKWFKAFTSKTAQFIVIYDEVRIEDSFEIIEALHTQKTNDNPVKVYVFSHGQYPFTEDFEEVLPLITLCALPDAIYKAYQNVLPKKKREVVPVLEEDAVGEEENLFNQDAH
ncbi:site-specific DNA-methyltransferase [Flavobacterium davisii]|uniref:site-specific DNA-methyltransferase (adenine-specific) n=1 Tax=Flavobacterium columnare TaxID=996 RepID=A0A8G0KT01_9FLAO|nr:site-specific DNA-methyltransferase [Flavobacterium davisii]QYS89647.1 site-specific DNA-methyltransferase [Flavobacterium davisii]